MAAWEWPRPAAAESASEQPSKLLPGLFDRVDEERRLVVLHVGAGSPETLDFFSQYRCRLYLNDLFLQLPFAEADDGEGPSLEEQFAAELQFPADSRFDICLFWDLFNYLDAAAIAAFLTVLRPHLHPGSLAHAFGVHNLRSTEVSQRYGVSQRDAITVRPRQQTVPGYSPHSPNELKSLLDCFLVERSVLLTDSRLELLLKVRPGSLPA